MMSIPDVEREFELIRVQEGRNESETLHPYYQLPNGNLVSKQEVCKAIQLLERFMQGHAPVYLTEEELFSNGNEVDAVLCFRQKHNCSVMEAKRAIEHLRGKATI